MHSGSLALLPTDTIEFDKTNSESADFLRYIQESPHPTRSLALDVTGVK